MPQNPLVLMSLDRCCTNLVDRYQWWDLDARNDSPASNIRGWRVITTKEGN
ncbi:hypothetical protein QUB56_18460 [Microcoleus sp. AR_TQ3_B6]|uniref:hypothetical protein n=1 Tax=Microcoleus sp. AR_TQ3_B6 TaxID=3055284 RepID=UPI002FD76A7D